MAPKEKAKCLIRDICNLIPIEANISDSAELAKSKINKDALATKLIAEYMLEELIKNASNNNVTIRFKGCFLSDKEYWMEVKQELEKL